MGTARCTTPRHTTPRHATPRGMIWDEVNGETDERARVVGEYTSSSPQLEVETSTPYEVESVALPSSSSSNFVVVLREYLGYFKENSMTGKSLPPSLNAICRYVEEGAPGRKLIFSSSLTTSRRNIVHEEAAKLNLFHCSNGEGEKRFVTIIASDATAILQSTLTDRSVIISKPTQLLQPHYMKMYLFHGQFSEPARLPASYFWVNRDMEHLIVSQHVSLHRHLSPTDLFEYFSTQQEAELIDTLESLVHMCNELKECDVIAFGCESNSNLFYMEKTCLLQISCHESDYIVDTMALWNNLKEYIAPIFENPNIIKIGFSVASCDVPGLYRDFGVSIKGLIDLQAASCVMEFEKSGERTSPTLASLLAKYKYPMSCGFKERKDDLREVNM